MRPYPHANSVCHPVNNFNVGGRTLSLYCIDGYPPSTCYTLYWDDTNDNNPVQHNMSVMEIFDVLHNLLEGGRGRN